MFSGSMLRFSSTRLASFALCVRRNWCYSQVGRSMFSRPYTYCTKKVAELDKKPTQTGIAGGGNELLIKAVRYDALPLVSQRKRLLGSPGALFRGVPSRPHRDKIAFAIPIRPLYILYMRLGGSPVHHHRHVDEITEKRILSDKFRGWDK